jgi:hypothetical protein
VLTNLQFNKFFEQVALLIFIIFLCFVYVSGLKDLERLAQGAWANRPTFQSLPVSIKFPGTPAAIFIQFLNLFQFLL